MSRGDVKILKEVVAQVSKICIARKESWRDGRVPIYFFEEMLIIERNL